MLEEENRQLRQEVALQKQMIEQLLAYNQVLRNQLSKTGDGKGEKEAIYSSNWEQQTEKETLYSNNFQEHGTKETLFALPEEEHGTKEAVYLKTEGDHATKETNDSKDPTIYGINKPLDSTDREGLHTKGFLSPSSGLGGGTNVPQNVLPQKIDPSQGNINSIALKLRSQKLLRMSLATRQKVAKLLIHIYNGGGGSQTEIRKATGYSQGGLAKAMMNLRAKHFLIKHKVRHHELSEKSLALFRQAQVK